MNNAWRIESEGTYEKKCAGETETLIKHCRDGLVMFSDPLMGTLPLMLQTEKCAHHSPST